MFRVSFVPAALAPLALAAATQAAFVNPPFVGQTGSTSQTWSSFSSPAGSAPTSSTNAAGTANWLDRTVATDGAFITGGHVYSFSGIVNPEIDVPLPALGTAGLSQVVLQTDVIGNPLDQTTFLATAAGKSYAPTSVVVTNTGSSGSGFGGGSFNYVVTWANLPATTAYSFTYSPNATSSSQVDARVDTLSAVPEPASLAAVVLASGGLLRRRARA